jgi:hypothetical protein
MTTPVRLLPDDEQIVWDWVAFHPDAQALIPGDPQDPDDPDIPARFYDRRPDDPIDPLGTFHRALGTEAVEGHLDAPVIHFEAWGPKPEVGTDAADAKAQAKDLARTLKAIMRDRDFVGTFDPTATTGGPLGVVTGTEDVMGITWAPDPETDQPRYIFQIRIFIHPTPA